MREILHISDIHFGPHHAPDVAAGVFELAERQKPDLLVVSGDLTQRAKARQFQDAREFIDRFSMPTLAVPGNHDVPMYRFWERLLAPFGAYRKHFSPVLEPDYEDEEMLVLGINTAKKFTIKNGRILKRCRDEVRRRLATASEAQLKIIVAHHELVPAPRFRALLDSQRLLAGRRRAVEAFGQSGVDLVLSGHLHQAYAVPSEAYYPSGKRPFLIAHSGTTTSTRGRGCEKLCHTCNWIRLEPDELTVTHLGWDTEEKRFAAWSRHHFPRRRSVPYGLEVL